ncbi:MAG: hypothetical protein LRY52_01075 [Sulfurospirillum cavolei]|nr:hypothetical protein [Sulfurospirillum cavolei]
MENGMPLRHVDMQKKCCYVQHQRSVDAG